MKKAYLSIAAKLSKAGVKVSNNTASTCWAYQPKAPKCLKKKKS